MSKKKGNKEKVSCADCPNWKEINNLEKTCIVQSETMDNLNKYIKHLEREIRLQPVKAGLLGIFHAAQKGIDEIFQENK